MKSGASHQEASGQLASLIPDLKKAGSYRKNAMVRLDVIPMLQGQTSDLRRPLMLLWGAVGFVFVLGCINIGGMLLARASGRIGEMATRLALGAPFLRIVRQLLIESTVLGLLGGLAGAIVGWGALAALREFGALTFPFLETVELDWRVLAATLVLTLIAGIAISDGPGVAGDAGGFEVGAIGKQRSSRAEEIYFARRAGRRRRSRLTVPLLFGAGLLLHTFLHLWNLNPGFDPNHVMIATFSLQDARYKTPDKMNQLYDNAIARLHQTPGIGAAAVSLTLPYERALNTGFRIAGSENFETTNMTYVTPEFFTALRIPVLQGRVFSQADGADSAQVVVVNQAFVKRYIKTGEPLGQPLSLGKKPSIIVGVVGDVQDRRAGWGDYGPIAMIPMVYTPATQAGGIEMVHTWFSPKWVVRSSLDGPQVMKAIEDATRSADPLLPMAEFHSVRDLKTDALTFERFLAVLAGTIAALAMLLSAMGIYGLISNLVTERTKELGIRMALGSGVGRAMEVALRPGLLWVLGGVAAGVFAALGLERFLKSFLWGVQPGDPLTLVGVGFGLLLATALASLIPASRIARLNPADTLRSE